MTGEQFDYLGALRRNWIIAVVVLVSTIAATLVVTAMQSRVYEASAELIVAPAQGALDTGDVIRSLETLERRTVVATFARLPATEEVRSAAAAQLSLSRAEARRFRTRGSVVPNTNIIRVDATGPDPQRVAEVANAAALHTARRAEALYRVFSLRFLARATPAREPAYPDRQRNYLVGLVLGLFLAAISALAAERLLRSRSREM